MNEFWLNNYQLIISTTITIIGLLLTYLGINKSFKNEVSKMKQRVSIESMQKVIYEICNLTALLTSKESTLEKNVDAFRKIMYTILSYGSKDAVKLAALMQQISYENERGESVDKFLPLSIYSLLIVQIKYDITSEIISPESYFKLQIKDYSKMETQIKEKINQVVDDLNLNKKFKV